MYDRFTRHSRSTYTSTQSEKCVGIGVRIFQVTIFDCQPNTKQLRTQHTLITHAWLFIRQCYQPMMTKDVCHVPPSHRKPTYMTAMKRWGIPNGSCHLDTSLYDTSHLWEWCLCSACHFVHDRSTLTVNTNRTKEHQYRNISISTSLRSFLQPWHHSECLSTSTGTLVSVLVSDHSYSPDIILNVSPPVQEH